MLQGACFLKPQLVELTTSGHTFPTVSKRGADHWPHSLANLPHKAAITVYPVSQTPSPTLTQPHL